MVARPEAARKALTLLGEMEATASNRVSLENNQSNSR
jgi:hypothetical protein